MATAGPTSAHSYPDPALSTALDAVTPALPDGVVVEVRPSVVDQLVVTNPTSARLDVLAAGGEPYLRASAAGVSANLASPDWYATQTPEGGPLPPPDVLRDKGKGAARWARVSRGSTWSAFDPRLRPLVDVPPGIRKAGRNRILTGWTIPLRYAGTAAVVTGHIAFRPVRGGLVVAVDASPFTATPLQGELPGLFARPPAGTLITGREGEPFLRFTGTDVQANAASVSWREDRAARGQPVLGSGWVLAGRGTSFSWLDGRLRYPADQPPDPGRRAVVQRWSVPVVVAGQAKAITGTVTWVPRDVALAGLRQQEDRERPSWWVLGSAASVVLTCGAWLLRRRSRPKRAEPRT